MDICVACLKNGCCWCAFFPQCLSSVMAQFHICFIHNKISIACLHECKLASSLRKKHKFHAKHELYPGRKISWMQTDFWWFPFSIELVDQTNIIFVVIVFRLMLLVKFLFCFPSLLPFPPLPFVCLSTWLLNSVHQTSFEGLRD